MELTNLETSVETPFAESTSEMELDTSPNGFLYIKQTTHIVLGTTDGELLKYLALFSSQSQHWKGLLVSMRTFLSIKYNDILQSVTTILGNYQCTPNRILQAFFIVPGVFGCAMRCADILPRLKNHGFTQVCEVYLSTKKTAPSEISSEVAEGGGNSDVPGFDNVLNPNTIPPTPSSLLSSSRNNACAKESVHHGSMLNTKGSVTGMNCLPVTNKTPAVMINRGAKLMAKPMGAIGPSS